MIVILKNGIRIAINYEIAQIINNRILSDGGAKNWQTFSSNTGLVNHIFNLSEISAMVPAETIKK